MKSHYKDIVKGNESAIEHYLKSFNYEEKVMYGAYGYPDYANNSVPIETIASGYYCADSIYHNDFRLIYLMNCMIDYLYTAHRPDFTVDNRESDYCCPPILVSIYLSRAYRIMEKYAQTEEQIALKDRLREYLEFPAKGISNGGIITPNHRWMGSSSALILYSIVKNKGLTDFAYGYLKEGVDIDEFGEYTERSPMYNRECDNAFIIIAEETKDNYYLECVRRNLELMLYYIEPDFTMFTQNSNRKDKQEGDVSASFYPDGFYHAYMYMSYLLKNPVFARMADDIFRNIKSRVDRGPSILWPFLLNPELMSYEPVLGDRPITFNIFHKDIVRRKNDDFSVTLLTRSPNFLFIQKGNLRCFVRICASFFAVAQFIPADIKKIDDDTYYMTMTGEGRYRGPLPDKPETSKWKEMDHSKRPIINQVQLTYHVKITLHDSKVELDIRTEGMDQVPYKVEFCFSAPCSVKNQNNEYEGQAGKHMTFKEADIDIQKDNNTLRITNTHNSHIYHDIMRGSVQKSMNSFTIYYTGFTHIDKHIEILEVGKS